METVKQTVAIWGVGKCMQDCYGDIAADEKISYFVDNASEKWGQRYTDDRIECICPDDLLKKEVTLVYIAIYDLKQYAKIQQQIKHLQIGSRHIYEVWTEKKQRKEILFLEKTGYLEREIYRRKSDERLVKYFCYTLPTNICNFRCDYCYMKQLAGESVFETAPWQKKMPHAPQYMAYSLRRERMGGICFVSLAAGGETLLVEGVEELVCELLKDGHIVKIATNGVITETLDKILEIPSDLLKNLIICFSVHYLELIKTHTLEIFLSNIEKVRDSAASLYTIIVASDVYYPYVKEIKEKFWDRLGIYPQVDVMRDDSDLLHPVILTQLSQEVYEDTWDSWGSEKFRFRRTEGLQEVHQCMAGKSYFYVDAFAGGVRYCSAFRNEQEDLTNIYQNLDKDIAVQPVKECPAKWCFAGADIFPLRILGDKVNAPAYGDMYQQVDKWGKSYIKPSLLELLNRDLG